MFTFLLICALTSLLTLGHASLPLVINTWPFKNAAAAGRPICYTTMNCVRQKKRDSFRLEPSHVTLWSKIAVKQNPHTRTHQNKKIYMIDFFLAEL